MSSGHGAAPSPPGKPGFFYGYVVVAVALLTTLVMYGTLFSFGVFFNPILVAFGWSRAALSGAYSLNRILLGLLGIFVGRWNDRLGPRLIAAVCGALLGSAYLLMSTVDHVWQLYLFYGVMVGAGMTGAFVPLLSTVARWFVSRRGLMTGLVVSGLGMGTLAVPILASRLILDYGWRSSYLIVGGIVFVTVVVIAQFLRRDPGQMGQLPYGCEKGAEENRDLQSRGLSTAGVVRTRQFWMLCAMFFCHGFGQQATFLHIVPHAIAVGLDPGTAANVLAFVGGSTVAGTLVMGAAIDRLGAKRVLVIVLGMVTAALFLMTAADEPWTLYLSAAIFGYGFGGILASYSPLVAGLFGLRAHGATLGMVIFALTIGSASGPLFAGRVFDVTGSYHAAFLTCAVLSIIAVLLAALLRPALREG